MEAEKLKTQLSRFTSDQIKLWQEFIKKNSHPKPAELQYLSSKLGMSPHVINTWFLTRQKKSVEMKPQKPPRKTRFSPEQIKVWQDFLKKNTYPKAADLKNLSNQLRIPPNLIDTWFLTRQKLSKTTSDVDLDSLDFDLPWLQTTFTGPTSTVFKQTQPSATITSGSSVGFVKLIFKPDQQTTLVNNQVTEVTRKSQDPPSPKIRKILPEENHVSTQPEPKFKVDNAAKLSCPRVSSSTTSKGYTQFKDLSLYVNKIKSISPYKLQFEGKVFEVHYDDLLAFFKDGNILSIVLFLLKLTLGDCLDEYTLTGSRQVKDPLTGRLGKIQGTAKKLPEELKMSIREFIRQMEFLVFHPDIMDNFDAFINCVFTKAFNRVQNLVKKRKDAAAKLRAKEFIE